jgi:hypothetical protein
MVSFPDEKHHAESAREGEYARIHMNHIIAQIFHSMGKISMFFCVSVGEKREEQDIPVFQQRSALRAGIKGKMLEGIRSHGLCQTLPRVQPQTQLQAKVIAAAINLVHIRQMLQCMQLALPRRRTHPLSPFARL